VAVDKDTVDALPWYHVLELPGGVTTKGYYDLRKVVHRILPDDLSGKRCLDAATASGFFAFEMEKRGAAEVVGIDLDRIEQRDWQLPWKLTPSANAVADSFEYAKRAFGSKATRIPCSLYDASPDTLGTFDFVFIGSVLLHLRDPVLALRALRTVTTGTLRSYEVHLLKASLLRPRMPVAQLARQADSRWWTPNRAAHRRWMVAAGFEIVDSSGWTFQPFGPLATGQKAGLVVLSMWRVNRLGERLVGVPSGWFDGRPAVPVES
jgi:tRNA (mo5U34)-methyltransferase